MSNLSKSAEQVIQTLEKKFSLEYIVKEAINDKNYSKLLQDTITINVCH